MLRDRRAAAHLAQVVSVTTFLAAAAAVLIAGAMQAAGRTGNSATLATFGYALGVAGIVTGVLALTLDSPADADTHQETP